jgi:hypothetical protein
MLERKRWRGARAGELLRKTNTEESDSQRVRAFVGQGGSSPGVTFRGGPLPL